MEVYEDGFSLLWPFGALHVLKLSLGGLTVFIYKCLVREDADKYKHDTILK